MSFRLALRSVFQGLTVVLFVILNSSRFLERTSSWEQSFRNKLLSKNPVKIAPMLRFLLAVGSIALLLPGGFFFFMTTTSSRAQREDHKLVALLNLNYVGSKFTRLLVFLFGSFLFISAPKSRHRTRFFWGFALPFAHSVLVFVAVWINPIRADGTRTLSNWELNMYFSAVTVVAHPLMLPFMENARGFLAMQPVAEIEIHFRWSIMFCLARLPPALYLISEAFGCMSNAATTDTCSLLVDCNFTVAVFLTMSSVFNLYLNHAQNHLEGHDFVHFRRLEPFSIVAFIWEGTSCALAYSAFGLRPKNIDNMFHSTSAKLESLASEEAPVAAVVYWLLKSTCFGFFVVGLLGFVHMRHSKARFISDVNGGDVDEYMSSKTVRCCVTFERSSKKLVDFVRVPEEEISVSIIYKGGIYGCILTPPLTFLIGIAGIWLAGDASQTPRWAFAMTSLSERWVPIQGFAATLLLFSDMKNQSR